MSDSDFFESMRAEIKSIGTDTRASDMRRFKASMIDKVFAMETGTRIREDILNHQQKKIERLEKKLAEVKKDLKFAMSFAPQSKAVKGLDPTFYHTLSYEGDTELDKRIEAIRKSLEGKEEE